MRATEQKEFLTKVSEALDKKWDPEEFQQFIYNNLITLGVSLYYYYSL